MKFSVQYLSFFVIHTDGQAPEAARRYKHYKTLDPLEYQDSEVRAFLDGEFARIGRRKADVHPTSDAVPTKIGRFIVEPGHELNSNPNYNLFQKLRSAQSKEQFHNGCDDMVRTYMDTSAVRGGAFIVALARLNEYTDEPFVFVLKCDFESKIARISDEKSLISRVEMAISARNIKSIQYPHMPEEGMIEPWELKIHQASHARYFEDFLKFVSYEKSVPEIVNDRVLELVNRYIETKWEEPQVGAPLPDDGARPTPPEPEPEDAREPAREQARERERHEIERWAAADKRDIQRKWTHEHVLEATARMVELQPDLDMRFKLDGVFVKGKMADYGDRVHIAQMNGRYVVLIVGDAFQFDKAVSPIELLQPDDLDRVLEQLKSGGRPRGGSDGPADGDVPWDEDE